MSESGKNRRDRAAAAREAANAGEKRRERIVRIVGAITVLVVVVGIIGVAVVVKNQASNEASTGTSTASADPNAALPVLATYLGHANIACTTIYLHPSTELLAQAGTRFEDHVTETAYGGRNE